MPTRHPLLPLLLLASPALPAALALALALAAIVPGRAEEAAPPPPPPAEDLLAEPRTDTRIKLTTLPDRERTVIRFEDNGAVLVEEERTLTLHRGVNHLDFTWVGVQIERDSIQILPVDADDLVLLRTLYPPAVPNSLVWDVYAPEPAPVAVRISYLLSGLHREVALRALVREGGPERLDIKLYQRLVNSSGETFDRAALRVAFGDLRDSPLVNGEIRQQLTATLRNVPYRRIYTFDPAAFGERVMVHYRFVNGRAQGLGTATLPGGKLRLFQETGETEAFLGEDLLTPVPIGEEALVRIGAAQDLVVRHAVMSRQPEGADLLVRVRYEIENFTGEEKELRLQNHPAHPEWTVRDFVQTLERRVTADRFEPTTGEDCPLAELERHDVDNLVITVSVPADRRLRLDFVQVLKQVRAP